MPAPPWRRLPTSTVRQARLPGVGVEPSLTGSMNTSAVPIEPSTKYCGSGGNWSRFANLFATTVGEYAKISRPVPRSCEVGKLVVSRPQTPASNACRKPSFEPTNDTLRRFACRVAKVRYEVVGPPGVKFDARYG